MNKTLFWDFDGTLSHSNPLWTGAVHKALESFDYRVSFDDVRAHMRFGFTWHTPEQDYSTIVGDKWWNLLFKHFNELYQLHNISKYEMSDINNKVRSLILKSENYDLYEDAVSTLSVCKNMGFDNYILSNNYPELPDVIKALSLSSYFKGYIVSSQIGYDKPRKELFEYALKLSDNPEVCYMIGDNPIADIHGGNNAGIKTILVHSDYACKADFILSNLSDILDVLDAV